MMNFSLARLRRISTHFVGNKHNEQELILSDAPLDLDEEAAERLKEYFLNKVASMYDRYQFAHNSSLDYNEVYCFIREILKDGNSLHDMSSQIAMHLYEKADHHNIKAGELHICHFTNCNLNNEVMEAIGIFKTEVKKGFFEVNREGEHEFSIEYREGIDPSKHDKGCLVFNTDAENGYEVVIFDNQSRGDEARYWKEDFLGLQQKNNEFHQTTQVLGLAKEFIASHAPGEFELPRTEQIDMLNKSVGYFKSHHDFDKEEFASEVFQDEALVNSFRSFEQNYREDNELELNDHFEISPEAVKKQARIFKSVLKLDKNFHIYIHGDRKLIEKGVEDNGRKYYKVYYEEER